MVKDGLRRPGLATVLVGEDPASQLYVRMKHAACVEAGIESFHYSLPVTACQSALDAVIDHLNQDDQVSGILVQLPLPDPFDAEQTLRRVALAKDVDGFHPVNIGRLAQKGRTALLPPCTPLGILTLLKLEIGNLAGKNAVVLGRSNVVGMPTALMLVKEDATVTICHSRSENLPAICRGADILVSAVGKPAYVKGDWVREGAVVIDVGISRVPDERSVRGYRMVGDVDFAEVSKVASAMTKVTGGVGPMTIAMLMRNTLAAAQMQQGMQPA